MAATNTVTTETTTSSSSASMASTDPSRPSQSPPWDKNDDISTSQQHSGKPTPCCSSYRIVALYKFVSPKFSKEILPKLKSEIETECYKYDCRGTLLLAEEGINGTICYPYIDRSDDGKAETTTTNDDDKLLQFLQSKFDNGLRIRVSSMKNEDEGAKPVFNRFKVKIKSNIVTLFPSSTSRSKYVMKERSQEGNSKNQDCHDAKDVNNDHDEEEDKDTATDTGIPSWWCDSTDPTQVVGEYVTPQQWNELLDDPDCIVVDTRNEYEIQLGTFQNAINPHTECFTEFPNWMASNLLTNTNDNEKGDKDGEAQERRRRPPKKIAMFCTGGIRCEKATSACIQLLKESKKNEETKKASENNDSNDSDTEIPKVYHLEGGILAYLDTIKPSESKYNGECYVFDQRVAVTYNCEPSTKYKSSCHACRHPLSIEEMDGNEHYVEGLSCKYCVNQLSDKQKQRFEMRQRQIQLGLHDFYQTPQQPTPPPININE